MTMVCVFDRNQYSLIDIVVDMFDSLTLFQITQHWSIISFHQRKLPFGVWSLTKMALTILNELITKFASKKQKAKCLSKTEFLIYKYFSKHKNIPYDLIALINDYYPNIALYGIGNNILGSLGIGKLGKIPKFTYLSQMSSLCDFDDEIYGNGLRFVIFKKLKNEIFSAGTNTQYCFDKLSDDLGDECINISFTKMYPLMTNENINLVQIISNQNTKLLIMMQLFIMRIVYKN